MRGRGRPTKYKPEYCEKLYEHMQEGYSYETFACVIRVHVDSLYEWEKKYREFSEAKKDSFIASQFQWEKIGLDGTLGKIKNFNASSYIFTMKNRFKWKDKQDEEDEGKTMIHPIVIETPIAGKTIELKLERKKNGRK